MDCDHDTSVVCLQNEVVARQNARHHSRERSQICPGQPPIEIDRRSEIDIEGAAQRYEDFLDRGIFRVDSDGVRAAANMHFRAHRRWSNCQGGAEQDRSPHADIGRADGAYWDDYQAGQFLSPAGAGGPIAVLQSFFRSNASRPRPFISRRSISRAATFMKIVNRR
jgi:hypothetical protein